MGGGFHASIKILMRGEPTDETVLPENAYQDRNTAHRYRRGISDQDVQSAPGPFINAMLAAPSNRLARTCWLDYCRRTLEWVGCAWRDSEHNSERSLGQPPFADLCGAPPHNRRRVS